MSRLGKKPLPIPAGVSVDITDGEVIVKGGKAELREKLLEGVNVVIEENEDNDGSSVVLSPSNESKEARAMWGTMWSLINNMIIGVTDGFTKVLEVIGVGYRASMDSTGKYLKIVVGYSHPILLLVPEGLDVSCETLKGKPPMVTIKGAKKKDVGQFAANVRELRKPEPYKGKGIKYNDEIIIRKESSKK